MIQSYSAKAAMAKSRAKSRRFLKVDQYRELLRQENVADVINYLRESTVYATCLEGVPVRGYSRQDLETRLRNSILYSYLEYIRYDRSGESFFNYVFVEYEIEKLIVCVHALRTGRIGSMEVDIPEVLLPHLSVDFSQLNSCRSFADLLSSLRHTRYHALLRRFMAGDPEKIDYIGCEAALWSYLQKFIFGRIASLQQPGERESLTRLYSQYLEYDNLRALYRFKAFPSVSADRANTYLQFISGGKLRRKEWNALVEAHDQAAFLEILQSTFLGQHLGDLRSSRLLGISYFGSLTTRRLFMSSKRLLHFTTDGASAFMAHLMLRRIEVQNLVTIIEGKHFGMDEENLRALLIY
jgi:vacuolar-type H+-ATPase subunit C/Vma6